MGFATQWRGQRDTAARQRLWKLVGLSLALHVPLTPLGALAGLFQLLAHRAETPVAYAPITAIPVDLLEDPGTAPAGATEPNAAPPQPKAAPPPDVDPFDQLDKESDDFGEAPPPKPKKTREAEPADAGPADAGADKGIGDPVALSGAAGRITDANANVRMIVFTDRIRDTVLGARVGSLLAAANQWHDFFGTSGLDPVKDFDRILIAGPQLRDSSQVVAVLRYNASEARVRSAVGALVDRDKQHGAWLDGGVPAARARADRAERVFAMPAPHLIVVAPPSAAAAALALPRSTRFPSPKGDEVMTAYVRMPWRAFVGIPFDIPKTIAWVRVSVGPTADGGAAATIEAEDESPEAAKADADMLTRAINLVTVVPIIGEHLIQPVDLRADGKRIVGSISATPKQLTQLIVIVANVAQEIADENARAAAEAAVDAGPAVVDAAPPPHPSDAGTALADAAARMRPATSVPSASASAPPAPPASPSSDAAR